MLVLKITPKLIQLLLTFAEISLEKLSEYINKFLMNMRPWGKKKESTGFSNLKVISEFIKSSFGEMKEGKLDQSHLYNEWEVKGRQHMQADLSWEMEK